MLDKIHLLLELISIGEEVSDDDIKCIRDEVEELEIDTLLNGEYDHSNCYLEIHPGAGGNLRA